MRSLRHSTPKTLLFALIASFLLLTSTTNAKELYVGDLNVSNNLVFSNLNIKQSFQCQNLLINTMSATTVKVNTLTMTDIYAEELINFGNQFITLQGSLNIKGSMSWNPEAATTQTVAAPVTTTTTETTEATVTTEESAAPAEPVEAVETAETVETIAEPAEPAPPVETTETVETPVEPAAPETPATENIPQVSFLKIDSLVLNGIKQWAMIGHENFDNARFSLMQLKNKEINGWRVKENQASNVESVVVPVKLETVHSSNHDDKALLTTHSNTIFKEFKKLPKHDSLMVEAQILLQAPAWKGEAVYAKVNDKIIWLEHYDSGEELDNCQLNESSWQRIPLSFNLKHNEESVLIEIGANSPLESFKNCKNLATKEVLGLDDFVMYVK